MSVPKEIEVKLELPPACVSDLKTIPLLCSPGKNAKSETQVSVYFDTGKHKLRKKGLMLRVRRVGDRYVQTIKATGNAGLFERDEWESDIAGETPDLRLARDTALEPLLSNKFCRKLKPVFETRVSRTTYPIEDGKRAVALTLDEGQIEAGRRSGPLCEVELELKRGEETELFELARMLSRAVPVQLALKSKAERGYELLEDKEKGAAKSAPIALVAGTSTRGGLRTIGRACLKQVVGNEPAVHAIDDQLTVAADVAGDRRDTRRHELEDGIRQPLGIGT